MDEFIFFEIEFGKGIAVEKGVLEKSFKIKIHSINANIEFPQVSSPLSYSNFNDPYLLTPKSIRKWYKDNFEWGMVTSIDQNNEIEVFVRKAILIIPFTNQIEGEKIINKMEDIKKSIELFRQYLSIHTKESFAPKYYNTRPKINYVTKNELRQKLDKKFNEKYSNPAYASIITYNALDSNLISKIIDYVEKLKEPPLSFQLLNEARKLFFQQKYRSNVFECASAVEVLLTDRIEKHIKKEYSNSFKDSILSKYNGLKSKYELACYLNLFKRKYGIVELAVLRNKAIHAGKTIERKEAAEALKITDDFIYSEVTHLS